MRDFSICVDIAASPQRVWDVLSDAEHWPEWTPSVTSVRMLDKPLAVGGRAIVRQPELPPARLKVTALDAGRSFTWAGGIPGIAFVHAHHRVDSGPQGARLTLRLRFDGLLGGFMGNRMKELNRRYLAMEAAGLKRFAEQGPRDPSVSLAQWNDEAQRAMQTDERV